MDEHLRHAQVRLEQALELERYGHQTTGLVAEAINTLRTAGCDDLADRLTGVLDHDIGALVTVREVLTEIEASR